MPWVTESGGTVCSPLKALFSQWIPDFPRAGAGLWAVLWDLGVRYCSPGPGGTSTSGQAVGPPGGGSCAGSEVSARLFPNSQTIGNLGIAIPKVNSRQLASIPGMQRNPSCARGSRFVRPPLGLQFPRGKRNPEGGGLRYAHARSAVGSVGPAWPFLPLPEIFRLCVCKSPIASKAAGPLWGRRWGGLSQYLPGTAFAWVILGRNVCAFGIGNGISWGRFLLNDPVFRCPSRAHTHNAATHESANFPNVTDPHE